MRVQNLQVNVLVQCFQPTFKVVGYGFMLLFLTFMLGACGLISAKPTKLAEAEPTLENKEVNVDLAGIDEGFVLGEPKLGNIALRMLALEQQTAILNQTDNQQIKGSFWLDGTVKRVQIDNQARQVKWIEVESIYDGERYIVATSPVIENADFLESVKIGQFVYLNGIYDTFSGFVATEAYTASDLLDSTIDRSQALANKTRQYDFGQVAAINKRKQVITFANGKKAQLSTKTLLYDAYAKQAVSKSSFWRALSEDDSVYVIATEPSKTKVSGNNDSLDTLEIASLWFLDKQASERAVVGTVKQINDAGTQIVLTTEMWRLKDSGRVDSQVAEVTLRLNRKSQLISSEGQLLNRGQALLAGQYVVVEGIQKNRALEVERMYLSAEKKLPVYAYGTVTGYQERDKLVDLTIEWMFGSEPSEILQVKVNDFTEISESSEDKASLSAATFWDLLSLNDGIEVEGQIVANTLEAKRLFLENKQLDIETLSGTVEMVYDQIIALRLYSYTDRHNKNVEDTLNQSSEKPLQDVIDLKLASDVKIQDVHLAQSIVATEFLVRLEPSDQLTVTGYFENNSFVAENIKFEDEDTTPFVFGEVEAFEIKSKEIMLKGENQVVVVNDLTTLTHTALGALSPEKFWTRLAIGDTIDIEGSYKEGIFVAKKVFLSSKVIKNKKIVEGEVLTFNIKTSNLQVKESDGFIVNVAIAEGSVFLAKNGKLYSQGGFWLDLAVGQQISVEGERMGSVINAEYITIDKTPAKKDSIGFFDWLSM